MATITPSRVDKNFRYSKNGLQSRRYAPGKGEIPRPSRDHSAVDFVRKRKKRNYDRDVGSSRGRHGGGYSDSDEDSDGSLADERMSRSRDKKRKAKSKGLMGGLFTTMQRNPDFVEQAHKLIRLSLHLILVGSVMFVGYKGYNAVSADIMTANRAAQAARLNQIAECTKQYQENQCVQNLPALRQLCEEWKNCMTDDPEAIFMVRNTIKEIASIINEFSGEMHLKAWVSDELLHQILSAHLVLILGCDVGLLFPCRHYVDHLQYLSGRACPSQARAFGAHGPALCYSGDRTLGSSNAQ